MIKTIIRFFLNNRLFTWILLALAVGWGLMTSPFDMDIGFLPKDPVAVDAIPDIGDNQQIVFTRWEGRSPQDIEDQITYPLTTTLLGIPGVKSVRSNSMFGFSIIYLIFNDDIEFYWSRSRIIEKLNSLSEGLLPEGVSPALGPDATALGQIFWYTLEGRDENGNPTGGWDLQELRSIQDFYVKYGLMSAEGVSEVASIGGFVKEYRVDVDPIAMKSKGVTLNDVMRAVKNSNLDVGAQTVEINQAEYFVRGLGYVKSIDDIAMSVVKTTDNTPIYVRDIGKVYLGPATRRGVLDKSGAQAVGGVVVARFGDNPLAVIKNVKEKIQHLASGLPSKILADGTVSHVTIVPFYDRSELIQETIGTLKEALSLEILITVIVVILLLFNLKSSILVAGTLPIAVLMCFVAMKYFGVDANIVSLSGIAIAIGTMVDMGIVLAESIIDRKEKMKGNEPLLTTIYEATIEVGSAVLTAVATTVISFLPVFAMEASEGKLFRPLAFTKTFALISAVIVALCFIPTLAFFVYGLKIDRKKWKIGFNILVLISSIVAFYIYGHPLILIPMTIGIVGLMQALIDLYFPERSKAFMISTNVVYALIIGVFLTRQWMPLGVEKSLFTNTVFVLGIVGLLLSLFWLVIVFYAHILSVLLKVKLLFLALVGFIIFQGFQVFKNTGQEFMPSLDEGSFLLMPTSMTHSGMEENIKNLRLLDMAVTAIPEVEQVVGKAGRVESALDPAPVSMYENIILYKSEYKTDKDGNRIRYKYKDGKYVKDKSGALIPDNNGRYFRQWRDHIRTPDDIWQEIVKATKLPGVTSAPKLQPIETRLVMLQTGMRAPMGIKVKGQDLRTIEKIGLELEKYLRKAEGVHDAAVFAERIVGKPYLLIDIDRKKIAKYGLNIVDVQRQLQVAIGGMSVGSTVEGRERYKIKVRYPLDYRSDVSSIENVYIDTRKYGQIPLKEIVDIRYEQGPQSIKSEDGFLVGYVLFDKEPGFAEVEVVNNAQKVIQKAIEKGEFVIPPGFNYSFAGNYEQQLRANKKLSIVIPIALGLIFLILYFQFKSISLTIMVFSGVFLAFAGGFIMIGLYDTSWFMNFNVFGENMRDLFHIAPINLSVAVWVGFLALFGIATDDGVLVGTFLQDSFKKSKPGTIAEIREAVIKGGTRRVRPAMMTTATTILALLPVLSSTGRGADIMLPMAIPSFGGMLLQMITMFTVPVLFSLRSEIELRIKNKLLK